MSEEYNNILDGFEGMTNDEDCVNQFIDNLFGSSDEDDNELYDDLEHFNGIMGFEEEEE